MTSLEDLLINKGKEYYVKKKRDLSPRSKYYFSLAEMVFKDGLRTIPPFEPGIMNYSFDHFVSVEGSNGSGKSTLLKFLIEFLKEDGCSISIKKSYPDCLPVELLFNLAMPEYAKFRNPLGRLFLAMSKLMYKYESLFSEDNRNTLIVEDRGKYSFFSIINNFLVRKNYDEEHISKTLLELNKEFPEPNLVLLLYGDTKKFCERCRTRTRHKYVAFRLDRPDNDIISDLDGFYCSMEDWLEKINANVRKINSCRSRERIFADFLKNVYPNFCIGNKKVKIYME